MTGSDTEVAASPRWIALVRTPARDMGACELSFVGRDPIDTGLARRQHEEYERALAELGCEVVQVAPLPEQPDSVFVEDTALVFDEVAIITRPGAESRRSETASVAERLAPLRPLRQIEAPATLDGGDVLRVGRRVFVGRSARSNDAGIEQLRRHLAEFGYQVEALEMHDCLHLKSAITQVGERLLLVNPRWLGADVLQRHFQGFELIEVDADEPHAANALRIGDRVIYPDCFPRTRERLQAAGVKLRCVAISELQKAEGAVTCCSLILRRGVDGQGG